MLSLRLVSLFEPTVYNLHTDGVVWPTLQTDAIHTHVMCYTYLMSLPVGVCGCTNGYGYEHSLVPVRVSCFPFFFTEPCLLHPFLLFVLTETDKPTDVGECIGIVGTAV